jgi:hypothetical protein
MLSDAPPMLVTVRVVGEMKVDPTATFPKLIAVGVTCKAVVTVRVPATYEKL